jgi:hypothetical protein
MSQPCKGKVRETRRGLTLAYSADSGLLRLQCSGCAAQFTGELEQLFLDAGASLSLDAPSGQSGTEHGFVLDSWGDAATGTGSAVSPVGGLPGIIKGLAPRLSLLLAAVPPEPSADALHALAGLVRPALGESPRILIVEQQSAGAVFAQRFPGAEISLQEAREAVDTLLTAPDQVDLLLLSPENGKVFERLALGLTGTHKLATTLECRGSALLSHHVAPEGTAVDPATLVLAAGTLLAATGRVDAAERLHNAVLTTLEDGLHTDALELLNPYNTRVPPARMIEAIASRLGQVPRRLTQARYATVSRPRAEHGHLRRVV